MKKVQGEQVSRRATLRAASVVLLATGLTQLAQGQGAASAAQAALLGRPPALDVVTVAVHRPTSLHHLPLVLAQSLGFFDDEGVSVQLVLADSDRSALWLVDKGAATLAACAYTTALSMSARAMPWRSLALVTRTPQVVLGLAPRHRPEHKGLADLRGARVGLPVGEAPRQVLEAVLRRMGLSTTDVAVVPFADPVQALEAYRRGQLDAFSVCDPAVLGLEQRGEVRVVADTRSLSGTHEVFGQLLPGVALCAPAPWLQSHASLAQPVVNGLVHALKWLRTAGPTDLIRVLTDSHLGRERGLYLSAFEKVRESFSPDGLMALGVAQVALSAQSLTDARVRGVDVEHTYTNEFAARAKQRFRV